MLLDQIHLTIGLSEWWVITSIRTWKIQFYSDGFLWSLESVAAAQHDNCGSLYPQTVNETLLYSVLVFVLLCQNVWVEQEGHKSVIFIQVALILFLVRQGFNVTFILVYFTGRSELEECFYHSGMCTYLRCHILRNFLFRRIATMGWSYFGRTKELERYGRIRTNETTSSTAAPYYAIRIYCTYRLIYAENVFLCFTLFKRYYAYLAYILLFFFER